ncbi:MAG: replicative DNA helicase [Dehalococcoidia bacterium SM23_28_2]|nr:MAG: replicative DNA helicase [Dehalococcoidia bacterium SM23_28_2]
MATVVAEKLPPHDIEAEEAVIASLLVDGEAIFKVAPLLHPPDFFREKNAWAYDACLALWQRSEAINQITLAHELARRGRLEEIGGVAYLSQLVAELPTPLGVEYYAQIVQRDAVYRRLLDASQRIQQMAYQGGPDLPAILSRAEGLLATVRGEKLVGDFVHIKELLERHVEGPLEEEGALSSEAHIRTGFMDLDTLLGGLKRADLVVLAARPSLGKTSLALNIARNAAVGQQATVAVFSLETAGEQVAQRLLAMESNVDSTRLRLGTHNEAEERRIMQAIGVLANVNIYVDDSAVVRVPEMRGKAWRLSRESRLDLIIVDYLQLMHGGVAAENRVQEISYISRSLKELARELNVPVIAVSQLSRAVEARATHIPMLSDLRESGSIEQDADVVLFIYREDAYVRRDEWERMHPDRPTDSYPAGISQIIVAKHRNGPTGAIHLRFRDKVARFEDLLVVQPEGDGGWS